MEFQIGDLVEAICDLDNTLSLTPIGGPKKGEQLIVTSIEHIYLGFKLDNLSAFFGQNVKLGKDPIWNRCYFKLIHRSKAVEILYGK